MFQLRSHSAFSSRYYISLHCDVTLSTSIKSPGTLTLQICSLLCVSLAEVQGNCPIFMEIRDNIHQLSFTSFIFISFPHINSYPVVIHRQQDFFGVSVETGASLRSLPWELYQTGTLWTWGAEQTSSDPLQSCTGSPRGFSHFLEEEETFSFLALSTPCCPYTTTAVYLSLKEARATSSIFQSIHTHLYSSI